MIKTVAADLLVQLYVEKCTVDEVDPRRVAAFALFGFGYMGMFQYMMYTKILGERVFPHAGRYAVKSFAEKLKDHKGTRDLFLQSGCDLFVIGPFIFMPCFYLAHEGMMGHSKDGVLSTTWHLWKTNFTDDFVMGCKIWAPLNFVIFGMVPLAWRIPAMSIVSFIYTAIVSSMHGGDTEVEITAEAEAAIAGARPMEELSVDSNELATLLAKFVTRGEPITFAEFKQLMNDLGVTDETVVRDFFDIFDADGSDTLTIEELSALIFSFTSGDQEERIVHMFDMLDLNKTGVLTHNEVAQLVYAMLLMRESVLVNGGDLETYETAGLAFAANSSRRKEKGVSKEEAAAKRLAQIKAKMPQFRGKKGKDAKLGDVLWWQAMEAATLMVLQCDTNRDGKVTREEFEIWINSDTTQAKSIIAMFQSIERCFNYELRRDHRLGKDAGKP